MIDNTSFFRMIDKYICCILIWFWLIAFFFFFSPIAIARLEKKNVR